MAWLYQPLTNYGTNSPATGVLAPVAPANQPAPNTYSTAYGGIPQLPNPTTTAANAITGNQANLPAINTLTTGTAQANAAGAGAAVAANLPGYGAMTQQASTNIGAELGGQLPADVIAQIQQQAAERGVATGSPGSPNSTASYLQSLGLNSLQLTEQGNQDLSAAVARTPTGPAVNAANMLVTPAQEQSASAGQSIYNAAPVPSAAGAANLAAQQAGRAAGATAAGQPQLPTAPTAPGTPVYSGQQGTTPQTTPYASASNDQTAQIQQLQMMYPGMTEEEAMALLGPVNGPGVSYNYGSDIYANGIPPAGSYSLSGPPPGPDAAANTSALGNALQSYYPPAAPDQ